MLNNRLSYTIHWIQLKTLVSQEIYRFSRVWIQSIFPPIITTGLYFIIFGNLIGKHIPKMQGHNYIDFIVPGLIMMAAINNAYTNVVFSFFSAKFQRSIEELLVSPIPSYIILIGYVTGGIARGVLVGLVVSLISMLFTHLSIFNLPLMLLITLLTTLLFSLGGFINAMFATKFDDVAIIPTFVLGPLTYLGGVFYSITLLPDFWQKVSLANPILYMINAFRYSFLGVSDININVAIFCIVLVDVILFVIAMSLLKRGYGLRT